MFLSNLMVLISGYIGMMLFQNSIIFIIWKFYPEKDHSDVTWNEREKHSVYEIFQS